MRSSGHMFGNSISSNEFPRGVFQSNEDFTSPSLAVIVAYLEGRHIQAANRNGLKTSPESSLRSWILGMLRINTNLIS